MNTRMLGRSGVKVSELCLGAMNFGNPRFGCPEAESLEILGAYLDAGGNFIDTANAYTAGASEEIVGKAIRGRRDAVVIATKGFFPPVAAFGEPPAHPNAHGASRLHLTAALEASLRRLGTDHVDLYQVHCWDDSTPIEETLSTLDGFVRGGKVRYVGLSNYTAWQIAESYQLALRHGREPWITAQMQWSLLARSIEDDVVPVCRRYGIGVLPWSPLGQGVLTGKYRKGEPAPPGSRFAPPPANATAAAWRARYWNDRSVEIAATVADLARRLESTPAAVSLAWLLGRPGVASVILGPKTVSQLQECLASADLELPEDAIETLNTASENPLRYPESFVQSATRRSQ